MKRAKKAKIPKVSKVGTIIPIKAYRRKVGALPARTGRGRFTKGGGKKGGGQTKLF